MRLFYEAPGARLWHGDCREAPAVVGEQRFSLILADPPYQQTSLAWDRWPSGWLKVMLHLRAQDGSLWSWGTLRTFMERAAEFFDGWRLAQDTIWEKHNGSQPATDRFLRVHEQAAHLYPASIPWESIYRDPQRVPAPREHRHKAGRVVHRRAQPAHTGKHRPSTYVDDGMRRQRSVWHVRSEHHQGRGTATPKPLGVLEPIVRYSCPPAGWVLVPFVGGGAEVEAAHASGRNVVGFDISEKELSTAARRLDQLRLGL
jgi:site-specific DNA-methyltransferase (adenine-specific)